MLQYAMVPLNLCNLQKSHDWDWKVEDPLPVGRGIYILFSNLLRRASSISHGKFVAARTITTFSASSSVVFPETPKQRMLSSNGQMNCNLVANEINKHERQTHECALQNCISFRGKKIHEHNCLYLSGKTPID